MYLTLVRLFPDAEQRDAVQRFLEGMLGSTRVQQGCLGCTLAVEAHPEALLLVESWQSEEDLLRRLRSDEYTKVLATMELSSAKPEVLIYDVARQSGLELIEQARDSCQDAAASHE
jgi:quinol monooxygenase YgiN